MEKMKTKQMKPHTNPKTKQMKKTEKMNKTKLEIAEIYHASSSSASRR
ncbi:unnamed protein product [Camellia sinensis]